MVTVCVECVRVQRVCSVCVAGAVCHACMWRTEDTFAESIFSYLFEPMVQVWKSSLFIHQAFLLALPLNFYKNCLVIYSVRAFCLQGNPPTLEWNPQSSGLNICTFKKNAFVTSTQESKTWHPKHILTRTWKGQ